MEAGSDGLEQGRRVIGGPPPRVVAGLLAAVEERPVARLECQELAHGAGGGVAGEPVGERTQDPELEPPRRPRHVGDRGGVPGAGSFPSPQVER